MTLIKTTKEGQRWVARFAYNFETKELVKAAGFCRDPTARYWWTTDPTVAAKIDPIWPSKPTPRSSPAAQPTLWLTSRSRWALPTCHISWPASTSARAA